MNKYLDEAIEHGALVKKTKLVTGEIINIIKFTEEELAEYTEAAIKQYLDNGIDNEQLIADAKEADIAELKAFASDLIATNAGLKNKIDALDAEIARLKAKIDELEMGISKKYYKHDKNRNAEIARLREALKENIADLEVAFAYCPNDDDFAYIGYTILSGKEALAQGEQELDK
jgi:predicted RNase H-like nuclease (RuvC/YqgF family)